MTTLQIQPISIISQPKRQPRRASKQTADEPKAVVVFVPDLWPDAKPALRRLMASLNVRQALSDWISGLVSGAINFN